LPSLENEVWNKRVESVRFPCSDVGSTPTSSTSSFPRPATMHSPSLRTWSATFLQCRDAACRVLEGKSEGIAARAPKVRQNTGRGFVLRTPPPACILYTPSGFTRSFAALNAEDFERSFAALVTLPRAPSSCSSRWTVPCSPASARRAGSSASHWAGTRSRRSRWTPSSSCRSP